MINKNPACLLIVDDEPDLIDVIKELSSDIAETVLTASNGEEALALILNNQIDAILSDINMPKMNGLELLAHIRSIGIETPFIILSGFGDKKNTVEALRLGASDFLDKPFDDQVLLDSLDTALKLGLEIRKFDSELVKTCEDFNIPKEKYQEMKEKKRTLWLLKKDFEIRNRKKVG